MQFPLTVLDWGGDTGKNTPFKGKSDSIDVYDISSKDVVEGVKIVSREEALSKKYRLVVCSNVLEHLPYPYDTLSEIMTVMDRYSVLYIEVPFEDIMLTCSADLHLHKKHWHEHINFFSAESLKKLVRSLGLEIIELNKLKATAGGRSSFLFQLSCRLMQ